VVLVIDFIGFVPLAFYRFSFSYVSAFFSLCLFCWILFFCRSFASVLTLFLRAKREADFTRAVENIVLRGGNCLIPVFALGRAQELLLILEEYWKEHPRLQHIPILYASKLATRSLRVYQTFVNMMNQNVQALGELLLP
jgi:hypothetical protein